MYRIIMHKMTSSVSHVTAYRQGTLLIHCMCLLRTVTLVIVKRVGWRALGGDEVYGKGDD